jgi:hypothetical protein
VLLLAVSFAMQPGWVVEWRDAVRETSMAGGRVPYTAPVLLPGGLLTLLAALRWRRPEARLIATLARTGMRVPCTTTIS